MKLAQSTFGMSLVLRKNVPRKGLYPLFFRFKLDEGVIEVSSKLYIAEKDWDQDWAALPGSSKIARKRAYAAAFPFCRRPNGFLMPCRFHPDL